LYQIFTTSVALGARLRAKSSSQAPIYVPGWGREGKLATVNFREFLFSTTFMNKASRRAEAAKNPGPISPLLVGARNLP
jgi:hypothetical protein